MASSDSHKRTFICQRDGLTCR